MHPRRPAAALAALALALYAEVARADLILGNLGAATTNAISLGPGFVRAVAAGFTVGPAAYSIDSARLPLIDTGIPESDVTLSLYSDGGGAPGNPLGTFATPTLPTVYTATATFTPAAPLSLAADTTYYLVLDVVPPGHVGSLNWGLADPGFVPSGPGATAIEGFDTSTASPAGPYLHDADYNPIYALNGTPAAVPEPPSLALAALAAVVGLGAWARRRE